mgnify:CR=1 FL=1
MAARYYDDAIAAKLKKWIPDNSRIRILKPDEVSRLFETKAEDTNDRPLDLPMVALSRNKDIKILQTTKSGCTYTL